MICGEYEMKKSGIFSPIILIFIIVCCALSSCSMTGGYDGQQYVREAMQYHTALEAARVTVTDMVNNVTVQEITYRFAGDVMQYMYIGRDAETGEEYYEFNNGTELDTWHSGDTEWSFAAKGTEGYYSYSRAKRHYFADGSLLLNDYAAAVSSSECTNEAGGGYIIRLRYDDAKLAEYQSMQGVTGMEQVYSVNNTGGQVGYMTLTLSYTKDGVQYRYRIDRTEPDPALPIERAEPEDLRTEEQQ